jgi:hypothetical protein
MEGRMTKTEIAKRLDDVAIVMRSLAIDMEYYFGFSPWSRHAQQMLGASFIAEEWADEIRKEIEHDNIIVTADSNHGRNRSPGNGAQKRKNRKRKAQKRQPKTEGKNNDRNVERLPTD